MSSMQPHNMLKATANEKKIYTWSVNTHIYQTKRAPPGLFSGLHVFLPPRVSLDYCVLISIAASSVGLMWRVQGPCESTGRVQDNEEHGSMCEDQCLTWRRARENEASVLFPVLTTPNCNRFPDSLQLKERLATLQTLLSPLSPLIFTPRSHLILHLSTSFAFAILSTNPRKNCAGHNSQHRIH